MPIAKVVYCSVAQLRGRDGGTYGLPVSEVEVTEEEAEDVQALGRKLHARQFGARDRTHFALILGVLD